MSAKIIDGKQVAAEMRAELKEKVAKLKQEGIIPGLAVVLVGEDPASTVYVKSKARKCEELGIYSAKHDLPATATQEDIMALAVKAVG